MSSFGIKLANQSIDEVDPYKILIKENQSFASGGFGRVFICRGRYDPSFECVVKEVYIPPNDNYVRMRNTVDREQEVIEKLRELDDHENIVKVFFYRMAADESLFSIFMEKMCGGDLHDFILRNGAQKEEIVLKYLKQIGNGIKHLHSHKIVHFDLKSSNILLDSPNDPQVLKICDYGLSKQFSGQNGRSTTYEYKGTLAFMAPEVYDAKDNEKKDPDERIGFNRKSDIWSFGVIGLHLAAGKLYSRGPVDIKRELVKFKCTCHKHNRVPFILSNFLVINPKKRCDIHSALELIMTPTPPVFNLDCMSDGPSNVSAELLEEWIQTMELALERMAAIEEHVVNEPNNEGSSRNNSSLNNGTHQRPASGSFGSARPGVIVQTVIKVVGWFVGTLWRL